MILFKKILKITIYIAINLLFTVIIYFLSLRPLAPSEEQLLTNYSNKSFNGFILECFVFASTLTVIFSLLSFIVYILFFKGKDMKLKIFIITALIYFVISIISSLQYFNFINSLVNNK